MALQAPSLRPKSRFAKHRRIVLHVLSIVIWAAVAITYAVNFGRYFGQSGHEWEDMLLARPAHVAMALLVVSLPQVLWVCVESYGNARIIALVEVLQRRAAGEKVEGTEQLDEEVFIADDDEEAGQETGDAKRRRAQVPWRVVHHYFWTLLWDTNPILQRTSPLAQYLGAVTALVSMDKEGTLVEPVSRPDQVFLYKDGGVTLHLAPKRNQEGHAYLEFEDSNWETHIPVLKPLGLNLLLNRPLCLHHQTKGNFIRCASQPPLSPTATRSPSLSPPLEDFHATVNWKRLFLTLSASFSRPYIPCMCLLSQAIGFTDKALSHFVPVKSVHIFSPDTLGGPAYMLSQVIRDRRSGNLQLLSKGNLPFLLQHCSQYWNGSKQICALTDADRACIMKEYQQLQDTFYCIGFSYKTLKKREMAVIGSLEDNPAGISFPLPHEQE